METSDRAGYTVASEAVLCTVPRCRCDGMGWTGRDADEVVKKKTRFD